jgi:hypothetical protein
MVLVLLVHPRGHPHWRGERSGPALNGPARELAWNEAESVRRMTYLRTSVAASAMSLALAAAALVSLNAKFLEILPPAL